MIWSVVGAAVVGHVLLVGIDVWAGRPGPAVLVSQRLDNTPSIDEGIVQSSESAALRLAQEAAGPVGPPQWMVGLVWMLVVALAFGVIAWVMRGEATD
jgi:hypothetical protein